ncbi:MAG: recombinase family protein [Verrucomicrobiae bacterium]|nr:recombinase family protein [Verrucomicrobiae bacterium]
MKSKPKHNGARSVGIWIRVSTDIQVEGESPERHEQRARAFVEAKGWEVVATYRLDAVSGKSVIQHHVAKRMLEDLHGGKIKALVFSKIARLARNTRELLEIADEFEKCGADLISLDENIDTSSPAGRVFFTMIAAMAQWEREEIASRIAASVPVRAKMGRSTGGKPVYGYHWVDGKMVPHPEEAPVRKLMYELYLKYRRKLRVVSILNERGYRTRGGKKWCYASVGRLLQDPTAKGRRRANFTRQLGGGKWEYKDQDEWVMVPVEPIVSEELWNECNRILEDGRQAHGLHKRKGRAPKYLFAGLLFCGACGNGVKMYLQTGTSKYRCYKCTNKIPMDDLEALFIEQVSDFLLDESRIAEFLSQAGEQLVRRRELIQALRKEQRDSEKKMETLVDLFQAGSIGRDEVKRQSQPIEERNEAIQTELSQLEFEIATLEAEQVSPQEVVRDGAKLVNQWFKLSFEKKRELVENLLSRVVVDRSDVEFDLKYLPTKSGKKCPPSNLFNYAKGFDPAWEDPNAALMPE